jgi:DNA-binding response OmpR family regulator
MSASHRDSPLALIIDDDIVTRAVIADALEELGMQVREAGDGADGLRQFAAESPDVVLLDVTMPGMNGFEVCRAMRADPHGAHLPILMLTGLDDELSVDEAFAAGATDFATKPCNIPLLRHRLRYVMRAKQTADQLRYRRGQSDPCAATGPRRQFRGRCRYRTTGAFRSGPPDVVRLPARHAADARLPARPCGRQ